MNPPNSPVSASEIERTRLQAFKELRGLLSEVLASAVADQEVPAAFKSIGNWEKLITQTEQRLADGWRERFEGDPHAKRGRPQGQMLDLLPEEEQLQQVLSERFVNEVSYNVRDPLDQLDRQLAALSGDGFDDRSANPLSPTAWAEGLRGGMRLMDCTQAERDWLMERLIQLLTARIGTFYSGLTARLQASGVVAPSRYGRSSGAMARASGDGVGSVGVGSAVGGSAGGGNSQEYYPDLVEQVVQPLPTGDGHPVPADDGSAALDRLFGLLSARRGPEQVAGQWPAYGGMHGGGTHGGGLHGNEMHGGGMPPSGYAPLPMGGDVGHRAQPVAPWSQADIFSILSLMQANQSPAAGAAVALSRLQEAISATASQLGLSGAAHQAMPAPAHDLLELVSMLFEALLDGRRLDKKARSQLSSLVVPYVRVAMLDRRMFMQSSHPARRVLNQLVEAFETAGPDVPQYSTLRELGFTTIERILNEFSDELTLFESLEKELSKEIDVCHRRADLSERRAAKSQDGKERRQAARESVAEWLKSAIGSRRLPSALLDFLCGRWQHHQNIVLLREGEAGEGVQANRSLLRDLLKAFDKSDLGDTTALRGRLDQVMHSSGHSVESVDDLLAELSLAFVVQADQERNATQIAAAEAAQAAALACLAAPPAADGDSSDEPVPVVSAQAASLPVEMVQRYVDAPIGAWLDFIGDDGRVSSARISWTSPISGKRILSNRRGQRILVATPQELAAMEMEGRLRPRQAEAAFDLALNAVADKLQAAAVTPG